MRMPEPDPAALRKLLDEFRRFGRHEIPPQGSPVYAALCEALADDPPRAAIAFHARSGFLGPLIVLAAVHHLLLSGTEHRLASYYPSVSGDGARPPDDGLYPAFSDFVDAHRERLERIIASHSTQTNEARRTVVTLPALGMIQRQAAAPIALLEAGASAGLNLLPDRYGYTVGGVATGDPLSAVQVDCAVEGDLRPPLPPRLDVAWRLGLDLNPLDVRDPETRAWLRALVWPEHRDRLALLDAALRVARHDPPLVVRGDLVDDLPALIAQAPREAALVVAATWVLAYLEPQRRREFVAMLAGRAVAEQRTIWLVAGEAESVVASLEVGIGAEPEEGFGGSTLSLHRFNADGVREHTMLAATHPHGRWIRWVDAASAAPAA